VIKYFMRYWSFSCGCVEGIGKALRISENWKEVKEKA
jgi:hypothetical protein